MNFYLKLKADHPALISIEDGFDEKDYEGWTRMTEAFAKAHPDFMIVRQTRKDSNEEWRLDSGWPVISLIAHPPILFMCMCVCVSQCVQVGDDLYTTNTDLIQKGIANKWANSLLLKVNQIGTVSESMDAARLIFADKGQVRQNNNFKVMQCSAVRWPLAEGCCYHRLTLFRRWLCVGDCEPPQR